MYKLQIENESNIFLRKEKSELINEKNECYIKVINKSKIKFQMKFTIFILILIFLFKIFLAGYSFYRYNIYNDEIIQKVGIKNYLKIEFVNEFNSYIKLCYKTKLNEKNNYISDKNPKLSVIMPIYNGGKYLNYSLVSIQNQNMKEIEIILIDDLSLDNSIIIIERFMKYDPRIRLIKNNKNKKILYSKSIAALNSNGEYIIELDQDDMFIRDNAFQLLYNEAKKYNLDLVQIRDFFKKKFYFIKRTPVNKIGLHYIRKKKTHYKTQPEIKDKLFTEDNNYLLWGLLIRTDLYKNAIYHLWPFIINYKIIFNEDYFITSMIAKLAKNYKFINKFALIHLKHSKSISHNYIQNKEFYLSLYLFLYYLHEYYIKKNPKNINILINYIYTDVSSFSKGIMLFPTLFEYIIQIILNNDYLKSKVKQKLFQDINLDIHPYYY